MKTKKDKIFLKLSKLIKTKEDSRLFMDFLIGHILNTTQITDNKLLDGFSIGIIYSNSGYVCGLIRNIDLPAMSDNVIQQLEQSIIWLLNNEDYLYKEFKQFKKLIDENFK